jgi:hypothetical protein
MQCASDGIRERSSNAHGIIFLEACNGVAYFWSKYAVDGAAIIAQSVQRRLHRTHISGLQNELFGGFERRDQTRATSMRVDRARDERSIDDEIFSQT